MKFKFLLFLFALSFIQINTAQVVISEIMYNNPGSDDLEFIELYNTSLDDIDMTGYSLASAVVHTFGAVTIPGQGYVLVSKNMAEFQNVFSLASIQWTSGSLNNSGENIQLLDASAQVVDEVTYSDNGAWSSLADGYGASLVLCDTKGDNTDPNLWQPASTNSNANFNNKTIFANPGSANECGMNGLVAFGHVTETVLEDGVQASTQIIVNNPGEAKTLTISVAANSSATIGEDFQFTTNSILLPANTIDTLITINIDIIDDNDEEQKETVILELNSNDNDINFLNDFFTLEIVDNDGVLASNLILTGVYDSELASGAGAKGVEIFVQEDIVDLSNYALGSANNGNGTDGEEFTFPSSSAMKGQFIYIAADSLKFRDYFGFDADYISSAMNINGDDAIEVFENGIVIDIMGDIDEDGSGTDWEYKDGWAYRKSGSGPDGNDFVIGNWNFSGVDNLGGADLNVDAPSPFPIGTYTQTITAAFRAVADNATVDMNANVIIDVLSNDERVDLLSELLTISVQPTNGMVTINADSTITYSPNTDFCGNDSFTYKGCEIGGCTEAVVTINVNCPIVYPEYTIATVTQNDENGISTFTDSTCTLTGIVYGVNLLDNGLSFTIIDSAGDGINVYKNENITGFTVNEGDAVSAKGKIGQYKGLTELLLVDIEVNSTNNNMILPVEVTALDESTESQLVILHDLTFVDETQWNGQGSGFNVDVTNGNDTFLVRIDDNVDLFSMSIPQGTSFTIAGIGGQYDPNSPYDEGYQLFPRYASDISGIDAVKEPDFAKGINLFPNPTSDYLVISTKSKIDEIAILNINGQTVLTVENPELNNSVNVAPFSNGIYFVRFIQNGQTWSQKFVKE